MYNLVMTFTDQLSSPQLALAQGLGIDVYRLRRATPLVSLDASEPAQQPEHTPPNSALAGQTATAPNQREAAGPDVPGARGELALMRAALGVERPEEASGGKITPTTTEPARPKSNDAVSEDVVESVRCELVAWRSDKAFLVCSAEMLNDDSQRLIQDLLRALDPAKKAARMQFSWPAGGGGPSDAVSAGKAWRAFWQRRTDGAQLLLAAADPLLEQWLAEVTGVHWLPALDSLVGNGEGKRALWQALAEHRQAVHGKGETVG